MSTKEPKYYSFAPGKAPANRKAQGITLQPGEKLAFREGKGYYAVPAAGKPAGNVNRSAAVPANAKGFTGVDPSTGLPKGGPYTVPTRKPPVAPFAALSPEEIQRQAGLVAQSGLTQQQDEIRRQQALAQQQAQADAAAIQGFQGASAKLMAGLGPEAEAGFLRASQEQGQLGQGLATGVAKDVADKVAADQAFAESQGQSGGSNIDNAALHDSVYALTGQIPGDTFAEQGAAANKWGLAQAPIALNAGREQLDARMAQARQDNDQYAQQLIQLAGQFPGLKAQALQQLNQYEIDKANYRESLVNDAATRKNNAGQLALQQRSERAQEKAAGVNASLDQQAQAYKWASLEFQTAKAKADAQAAAKKGKGIDVAASKLLGHIVYKDGTEDPSIKVKQTADANDPHVKAQQNRAKAVSAAKVTAFKSAESLRGTPVKTPKGKGKGTYLAAPGQGWGKGGVFTPAYPGAPATTNNPDRAAREGGASSYADAASQIWALIDGDGLVSRYGYSKEQVNSFINDAMRRAGWKR